MTYDIDFWVSFAKESKIRKRYKYYQIFLIKDVVNQLKSVKNLKWAFHKDPNLLCALCGVNFEYAVCGQLHGHICHDKHGPKKHHWNLYTANFDLLTRDHIVPRSVGGVDTKTNIQIACYECNVKKGNNV